MLRPTISIALFAAAAAALPAQDLRKGLADADLVVVARQAGRKPVTDGVVLHRLQVVEGLRGRDSEREAVGVLEWTDESHHNRPAAHQQRLYCLVDAAQKARQLGLPADAGPYYKLVGWAGSNPLVTGALDDSAVVRFARVLAAAERGAAPAETAAAIAGMALADDAVVRLEATRLLAERPQLRARLSGVQWSELLTRASAETADITYKIALAELCAEQRLDGIVEALVIGLGTVHDAEYARAVGRLAAHLQGDQSARPLLERLRNHGGDQETRAALLLALGATRTGPALEALVELKRTVTDDRAIDAALREHQSKRALEAVLRGKGQGGGK